MRAIALDSIQLTVGMVHLSAYSEIGAAAMVHPNAPLIVTPAIALLATRITASMSDLHPAPYIRGAVVPVAIIGGAGKGLASAIAVVPASVDRKVCTATVIYPDTVRIVSPAITLLAGCSAALIGHLHAAPRIDTAGVPSTVVGRTGNGLATPVPSIVPVAAVVPTVHHEVGAAAMVYPDASLIVAPAIALLASRSAALIGHLHAASRIHRAGVPSTIVRRAGDDLAAIPATIPSVVPTVHHEVGAATVVYPDALAVVSPAITFLAGCSAALIGHLHAAPRIDTAGMPSTVVGRAGDGLLCHGGLSRSCKNKPE
jgi:hypothetical protein